MGVARKPFSGSAGKTVRLGSQYESLFIVNNGGSALTFTTGDAFTFTLDPGETFDEVIDPFDTLTITATSSYKGFVREEVYQ
ncbi:hypothetical protein [Paenibacillus sp. SI8]|uniref:hypothetical protein n=1 Tax=unclassified Paenibacillus TaxID=185978 RepID=UPI003465D83C